MSAQKDFSTELKKEHVAVEMLGRYGDYTRNDGAKLSSLKLWCCFYDRESQTVKVAFGRMLGDAGYGQMMWQKLSGSMEITSMTKRSIHAEIIERIADKRRNRFNTLPGHWYIQPETRRIFELSEIRADHQREVNLRDVDLHGLERVGPSPFLPERPEEVSPAIVPDARIIERLANANPMANQWFG